MRFLKFIFSRLFFCLIVIAAIFTAIIFLCLYLHSLLPAAVGAAAAYALSITCALFLFCRDGENDIKCAWLAVIAALPIVGALLYALSCTGAKRSVDNSVPPPPSSYSDCEYFSDGSHYYNRLFECIAEAKHTVYLEYYIVSKGQIWSKLYAQLKKALERGVKVKFIYDGFGSAMHAPKKDFKRLRKSGAEIKIFNKLSPFPVSRLNCRNHRKIAAIDSEKVFLGGVNVADEYANISSPHGYWKDGGIMLTGAIAEAYEDVFLTDFYGKNRVSKVNREESGGDESQSLHKVIPITDAPVYKKSCCKELVAAKIYAATERVCIFTPYLCVGEKLKDALTYAAGRGVRVQIIIPEIPDKRITFEVTLSFAAELLKYGIEIYRYTPGFMHSKCVICDDEVLLGSYNFDYRSMNLNYECGIWAAGKLTGDAYADFKESLYASAEMKERRISIARKAVRGALKLFSPLV